MTFTHALSTNNYGPAKFIVATSAANGTHTTIQSAINAATSGDTVFIRPGTYAESLTLKAGVNLSAFPCDYMPFNFFSGSANVRINGKMTYTGNGQVSISGIELSNDAPDNFLVISGTNPSEVFLIGCFLALYPAIGISYTASNIASFLFILNCQGSCSAAGAGLLSASSTGFTFISNCDFRNSGLSSTDLISISSGFLTISECTFGSGITVSGTANCIVKDLQIKNTFNLKSINYTSSDTTSKVECSQFYSGTSTAITVNTGTLQLDHCNINTTNSTAAIDGNGTLNYAVLSFSSTGNIITTSNQTIMNEGPSKTIGNINVGGTNTLTVTNSDNTNASSGANIKALVGGTSAGDPTHQSVVSGTTTWTWGADNSITTPSADPWVLAASASLGTTNIISAFTGGQINYPLLPCFLARLNSVSNVTGDGTNYTVIFDVSAYDQNSNYNTGTGTFTAPATGKYTFTAGVDLTGLLVGHTSFTFRINTTARNFDLILTNPFTAAVSGSQIWQGTVTTSMTAADTATVSVLVSGGTKVVGLFGDTSAIRTTWFSGQQVA